MRGIVLQSHEDRGRGRLSAHGSDHGEERRLQPVPVGVRGGGKPIVNRYKTMGEIPAETEISRIISKNLKARGFKFCGPTIIYAFMQATGMVNDHLTSCPRHAACVKLGRTPSNP
jgi:hypothetical protein